MFRKLSVLLDVTSNTAECNHDEGIMIVLFFFFLTLKAFYWFEISNVLYTVSRGYCLTLFIRTQYTMLQIKPKSLLTLTIDRLKLLTYQGLL